MKRMSVTFGQRILWRFGEFPKGSLDSVSGQVLWCSRKYLGKGRSDGRGLCFGCSKEGI